MEHYRTLKAREAEGLQSYRTGMIRKGLETLEEVMKTAESSLGVDD